jgi:hypothetical protein
LGLPEEIDGNPLRFFLKRAPQVSPLSRLTGAVAAKSAPLRRH